MSHSYEVVGELYWDGVQLRKKGDIIKTDEPLKIAAKSGQYTPSLREIPEPIPEEHHESKGRKGKTDTI